MLGKRGYRITVNNNNRVCPVRTEKLRDYVNNASGLPKEVKKNK